MQGLPLTSTVKLIQDRMPKDWHATLRLGNAPLKHAFISGVSLFGACYRLERIKALCSSQAAISE